MMLYRVMRNMRTFRRNWCWWFSRCIFAILLFIFVVLGFPWLKRFDIIQFKRGIAKQLQQVHQEMVELSINKKPPSMKLLMRMEEILHRLDDRIKISKSHGVYTQQSTVDVCPEVYKGAKIGYPLYAKGWVTTNCTNAKPIHTVISVLINTVEYSREDEKHVNNVIEGITQTYPTVQVYLATRSKELKEAADKYNAVHVISVRNADKKNILGKTWNELINAASTPYVVIARDVVHFSWLSQLERQIRVASQIPKVVAAGGAFRNLSGQWKMGCLQSTLQNYVLEYQEGYFHSRNECMFCDYLQGPFVAKKNMLKFDEDLPNAVVFEDLFLTITESGSLIMGCPDAMYFTTDYSSHPKRTYQSVWTSLARKWQLNRVLLPGSVKHSFTCQDIGFKCDKKITNYYLLPVCCQEQYADALKVFQAFSDQHNISFELDSGSVLGTVKFNGLIPWDIDGDLSILSSDMGIFGEKKTIEYFKKRGYSLTDFKPPEVDENTGLSSGGYSNLRLPELYFEMWGMRSLTNSKLLPPEMQSRQSFTKANVRGSWVNTVFNPGMWARNRYGIEVLKHAQSWVQTGLENSYSQYIGGTFKSCKEPQHHACLQNFPVDGNIPILIP